jgi:hypothetical protein
LVGDDVTDDNAQGLLYQNEHYDTEAYKERNSSASVNNNNNNSLILILVNLAAENSV